MKKLLIPLLLLSACTQGIRFQNKDFLQVPSPDWSKQIIYFVMTDRFNDGNTNNNNQGANEYNPSLNSHYSGGDLQGIIDKLDYIQGLGVTALWITPPVLNQWNNPSVNYTGYHGYWASDFSKIDPHVGTIADYQKLSRELHRRGMFLIQDIVCNHTGDFFAYTHYDPKHPELGLIFNTNSTPPLHPSQYPFNLNNPADPDQKRAAIYHWTPNISHYQNTNQILTYQMSGLDDLNTSNPTVRNILKDSFNFWIKKIGVDGFRIDTALYVEHDFWNDFLYSTDHAHPGIKSFATILGKKNFYVFGEAWVNVRPYENRGDLIAASFQGTKQKPEMDAPIAFPLQVTLQRVFGENKPTAWLSYRIKHLLEDYQHTEILPTFIDNHDMNRFLKSSDTISLKQALLTLFTLPGVPVIYYGTEQGFTETRSSMFATGYGSDKTNHFDTSSELYTFISKLSRLRKSNASFRSANISLLSDNPVRSGVFAYIKTSGSQKILVLINTSTHTALLNPIALPWKAGTILKPIFSLSKHPKIKTLDSKAHLALILPPKTAEILMPDKKQATHISGKKLSVSTFIQNRKYKKNFTVHGQLTKGKNLRMVIDGDVTHSFRIKTSLDGKWESSIPVENLPNGKHFVSFYTRDTNRQFIIVKGPFFFEVKIPYILSAVWKDPVGDDSGPSGSYIYPTDPSFFHQGDLQEVKLSYAGNNIKIELTLTEKLSTVWNPRLGFDHVTFAIFVDLPNKSGSHVLPQLNANAPQGFEWNVMALVGGWMNFMFNAKDSDHTSFGTPMKPAPTVKTDPVNQTVSITLNLSSLRISSLKKARVYVCTWDYDGLEGKFRPIAPNAAPFTFGGGKTNSPKILDDIPILEIR